jgi:hypothetical protein
MPKIHCKRTGVLSITHKFLIGVSELEIYLASDSTDVRYGCSVCD